MRSLFSRNAAPVSALIIPNGFEANFTIGFIRGLHENGVPVHVGSCPETHARLIALGVPCTQVLATPRSAFGFLRKVIALLRYYMRTLRLLIAHRGAVMHFTGVFRNTRVLIEGFLFVAALRIFASRFIYTAHNTLPHGKDGSRLFAWIYRQIYRFPHTILVHTERARRQLIEEFGVPERKLVLTSIGLNEEMPDRGLTQTEARQALNLAPDLKVTLFFGKIEPYKGLDTLLDALARLDGTDTTLLVAGVIPSGEYRARILTQLAASSRRDSIHLHEAHIPNEAVETYFKAADVLCLPYRNIYQSGLVFLAPRFGLPIVSTDVGSLKEFLEPHFGLVCDANDAAGLARTLQRFFSEKQRFTREAIMEKAQAYRWRNVCKPLVPLYQRHER